MSLFSSNQRGFTLVELMIAMAIGGLLVLMAMVLYVPVSRSLLDQAAISQQSMSESVNYEFDVMNSANAGYGIVNPQVNTNLILVNGTGPGNNTAVPIPTNGSATGNGLFWNWQSPVASGVLSCAGLQVIASTTQSGNERLVYYQEIPGSGTCTGTPWNTPANWDVVTVVPSIASGAVTPIQVTMNQNCDLRGSQIAGHPVLYPAVSLQLPIAGTLTGGFFSHTFGLVPVTVCMRNLS